MIRRFKYRGGWWYSTADGDLAAEICAPGLARIIEQPDVRRDKLILVARLTKTEPTHGQAFEYSLRRTPYPHFDRDRAFLVERPRMTMSWQAEKILLTAYRVAGYRYVSFYWEKAE